MEHTRRQRGMLSPWGKRGMLSPWGKRGMQSLWGKSTAMGVKRSDDSKS